MPAERPVRILLLGDIIGKPGRRALGKHLPGLVEELDVDLVVANAENASGGLGLTPKVAGELLGMGIHVLTSGNHIWKHKEIRPYLEDEPRLLRPANYPAGAPGRGSGVYTTAAGIEVGVINLEGQLFMSPLPSPFREADRLIERLRGRARIIVVDFHAEATSEKRALGLYLDGRITALVGTHTHVPTADAEVLPQGSGYLSDLGMCGTTDSVIGVRKEQAISRFVTQLPSSFQVARGRLQIQGALVTADPASGRCLEISRHTWPGE